MSAWAEAAALAGGLGGEERLERVRAHLRRHAVTGVDGGLHGGGREQLARLAPKVHGMELGRSGQRRSVDAEDALPVLGSLQQTPRALAAHLGLGEAEDLRE